MESSVFVPDCADWAQQRYSIEMSMSTNVPYNVILGKLSIIEILKKL